MDAYFCYVGGSKSIWWLAGWYPSSLDASAGNFIGRHAAAFAQYQRGRKDSFGLVLFHFPVYRLGKDARPMSVMEVDGVVGVDDVAGVSGVEVVWKAVGQLPWGGGVFRVLNYWIYNVDGLDYYVPNYGYLVLFDSKYSDLEDCCGDGAAAVRRSAWDSRGGACSCG